MTLHAFSPQRQNVGVPLPQTPMRYVTEMCANFVMACLLHSLPLPKTSAGLQ